MRNTSTKSELNVFAKVIKHNVPNFKEIIREIPDPRKKKKYSLEYLIMSELMMFMSGGGSQRYTERAYNDSNYLKNISKLIKEKVEKIPDAEIYTDVFGRISKEEMQKFQNKITYRMIRSKMYENAKEFGKYNMILDGTRFQKANYKINDEWLKQTKDGKTTWYIGTLDMKLAANKMCVPIMNEFMKNQDIAEDNKEKTEEVKKQDCEINAAKRLIDNFKNYYPRLPIRIIADSLYPAKTILEKLRENNIEYIFVLKDKKIKTVTAEFLTLVSNPEANRVLEEADDEIVFTMWINEIDYENEKINIIRQIKKNKKTGKSSVWMWMTNRTITEKNVKTIIKCAKTRDYIENQGFREQKITTGLELEHVYSKNTNAIFAIYILLQLAHLLIQIIEHSDIIEGFKKVYGSIKEFRMRFFSKIREGLIDEEYLEQKIQIRYSI